MKSLSIAVKKYDHTAFLQSKTQLHGHSVSVEGIEPIYKAFKPMVSELKYDFCEMALGTYLQARDCGAEVTLLPIVLSGNFHHQSLWRKPGNGGISPRDLRGKHVGVRAYSQTTGLWVRGVLSEEYGVDATEITWVTTEAPHVQSYREPDNVVRTQESLLDLLDRGELSAAIVGSLALDDPNIQLEPVISDWRAAQSSWEQRNGTIPINHMLTVRRDLFHENPALVSRIYDDFAHEMSQSLLRKPADTPRRRALRCGMTQSLLNGVETASRYAFEQELVEKPQSTDEIFSDFANLYEIVRH